MAFSCFIDRSSRDVRGNVAAALVAAVCLAMAGCASLAVPRGDGFPGEREARGSITSGGGRAAQLIERDIRRLEELGGAATVGQPQRLASLRLTSRAVGHLRDGDNHRALDVLERAISIDGAVGFAYLFMAAAHYNLGDVTRAAGFIERAMPLLPDDRALHEELDSLRADVYASTLTPVERVY